MIGRTATCFLLAAALVWAALSPRHSRSADEKFDRIGEGKMAPGEAIAFSEDEINSYLRYDFAGNVPKGVTEPYIRMDRDRVLGNAIVDFVEFQAGRGAPPGRLLSWLLEGQRRVNVVCRFTSANGTGRVDVESVEIDGAAVSPGIINFLIEKVVTPRYPAATVGRDFALGYNLQQVRIEKGKAVAIAK